MAQLDATIPISANIFTILLAIAVLISGSIIIRDTTFLSDIWGSLYVLSILYVVIAAIAIVVAVALLFSINRKLPALTTVFSVSLLVNVVLATACWIVLVVGLINLRTDSFARTLVLSSSYNFTYPPQDTIPALTKIQQTLKCCGVNQATDFRTPFPDGKSIPDTCCRKVVPKCGIDALLHNNTIYFDGCALVLDSYLRPRHVALITIGIGLILVMMVAALLGLAYQRQVRKEYESM